MDADQQFCLRWNNHQSTLISVFDTLLEKGTLVDCTIAAEGQFMKAHKVVLSACSPYFEILLSQHYEKHPIVILKDVKFQELKAMMDYMYRGEVNISQDQLASILKVAESLQIKGLSESGGGNEKELPERKQEPKKSVPPPSHTPSASQPVRNLEGRKAPVTHSTPIAEAPIESPPVTPRPISRNECSSPIARKRKKHRQYSNEDTGASALIDGLENSSSNELPPPARRQSTSGFPPPIAAVSVPGKPTSTPTFKGKLEPETRSSPQVSHADATHAKPVPPAVPIETEVTPKVEPSQAAEETFLEPKTEFVEEHEDIEDLTLDDDDEDDDMLDQSQPGPSHGGDLSNQGYEQWQMDQSQDDVFMAAQEAVGAQRDSQGEERRFLIGEVVPNIVAIESMSRSEMEELIIPEQTGNKTKTGETTSQCSNQLYDILNKSLEGKVILAHAAKSGGMLQNYHRKQIAQLILAHELLIYPNRKISSEEFMGWAQQISKLFPKELPSIYFTAYKASDQFRPKKNAGGKLYEAYVSKRRKLRKFGEIPSVCRSSGTSATSASTSFSSRSFLETTEDMDEDSDIQEKIEWLKNSVEPWHLVEMKWWQTTNIRLRSLEREREQGNIAEYFNKFPALKTSNGFRLLLQDFSYIYPGRENIIYSTILKYRQQIIKLGEEKIRASRDKDIKAIMQSYIALTEDGDSETETNVALILLPYIVTLSPGKKKARDIWKPSRAETRDGFITQIRSAADLETTVRSRKEKLLNFGYTFQPLVLFVGNSIANVRAAYAVVDETFYKCNSLLAAVDLTFKIFHSTFAKYPEESENVWLLIQLGLYNIETKYDRISAGVNSLLVDLGIKAKE